MSLRGAGGWASTARLTALTLMRLGRLLFSALILLLARLLLSAGLVTTGLLSILALPSASLLVE